MSNGAAVGPDTPAPRLVLAIVAAAVVAGIALRLMWLDRLPGIDGDEAWYGVIGQHWAAGDFVFWRTPTGNYPGPLQLAADAIGQLVAPGSFIVLRAAPLLSSLAAMALAWRIGRRHFDPATARLALLIMAVLPGNIAFARFGWDPSHSALIVVGGAALALERRLVATIAVYALAVFTHPTNVFCAPLLLLLFVAGERSFGERRWLSPRNVVLALTMVVLAGAMIASTASQAGQFVDPGAALRRLISPTEWLAFAILLGRLIAGEPFFAHLAGSSYGALLPLVAGIGIAGFGGLVFVTVTTLRNEGLTKRAALLLGWLAMIAAFAAVAGSGALNTPTERYVFVLVAPTAMAMALALRRLIADSPAREVAIGTTIGATLLAATIALYIVPLATRDRPISRYLGVDGLRTGPVEPKEAAARWIIAEAKRDGPLQLIADDWWLYWPMRYRLAGQPVHVVHAGKRRSSIRTFEVKFAAVPGAPHGPNPGGAAPVWVSTGYDRRAILRIWRR